MQQLIHEVREYDAQRDGMQLVSGWAVYACVQVNPTRRTVPILMAICPNKDDAEEIVELMNERYLNG